MPVGSCNLEGLHDFHFDGDVAMDRSTVRKKCSRWVALCLIGSFTGCVTNPLPVATVWDKLGITGASARLRDATLNRSGNYPGREKKPPLLRISDPANLAADKPEAIKTAAKIKQDQDLKPQKIKALKFLAEVNCGCYNKDDQVAKAFLEALNDCDPEVRTAAIEGICKTASNCSSCRTGCETSCCSEEIVKKLNDLATGVDAKGCYKETNKDIRRLAAAAANKCGCPEPAPIEEVPAPDPIPERTGERRPDEDRPAPTGERRPDDAGIRLPQPESGVQKVSFTISEESIKSQTAPTKQIASRGGKSEPKPNVAKDSYGTGSEPVAIAKRRGANGETIRSVANADQLVKSYVHTVTVKSSGKCELVINLPNAYDLPVDSNMVLVDTSGNQQVGKVVNISGKQVTILLSSECALKAFGGAEMKVGLIGE
jgi:hypothetical protein